MQPFDHHRGLGAGASSVVLLSIILLATSVSTQPFIVRAQSAGEVVIFVWSNQYQTSNVTDTGLTPGRSLEIEINVTMAPEFNGFDLTVLYDPALLNVSSIDASQGTVFGSRASVIQNSLSGELHLTIVGLGPEAVYRDQNGTLVHIRFGVQGLGISLLVLSDTRLVLGGALSSTEIPHRTMNGHFNNVGGEKAAPVALFSYEPASPFEGELVSFDASQSFDPDNSAISNGGIFAFQWRFGDGISVTVSSPLVSHRYAISSGGTLVGNFTVVLTVTDSDSFLGIRVQRLSVQQRPVHDIEIFSIQASPVEVQQGNLVAVKVQVRNIGTSLEVFDLVIEYGTPRVVLEKIAGQNIGVKQTLAFNASLETRGLPSGAYIVKATATIPQDDSLSNNEKVATIRIVEPPRNLSMFIIASLVVSAVGIVVYAVRRGGRNKQ